MTKEKEIIPELVQQVDNLKFTGLHIQQIWKEKIVNSTGATEYTAYALLQYILFRYKSKKLSSTVTITRLNRRPYLVITTKQLQKELNIKPRALKRCLNLLQELNLISVKEEKYKSEKTDKFYTVGLCIRPNIDELKRIQETKTQEK